MDLLGSLGSNPWRNRRNDSRSHDAIRFESGSPCRDEGGGTVDRRELVVQAGRGDHDAFAVLATAAAARLDGAARLILRDRELARDAVQNTLVRAWRDLPGLRDPDRFDAWLHRLLVNACLDEARRRRRWPIEVDILPIDVPTPDGASQLADRDLIDRALARLDPPQRALVVLHYLFGYPVPDAAELLGISLSAAKSRLHRAMTALRLVLIVDPIEIRLAERGTVS